MKKQATIVGLLIIIVLSFSMTISESVRLGYRYFANDTISYQNSLSAKAGNIPIVPVTVTPNSSSGPAPTTPIETIFLAGGHSINYLSYVNSVISSNDGVLYGQLTTNALWSPRSDHTLTVLSSYLFVMGGSNIIGPVGPNPLYTEYNDVYLSSDGINWFQFLANAPWVPRSRHKTIPFNGQLFLMGGSTWIPSWTRTYLNDVWSSGDGINWTSLGNATWAGRDNFASVVFNNQIFVIAGDGQNQSFGDVWSSMDGINWIQRIANAPWGPFRYGHSAIVFNGKIYVIGGQSGNSLTNDVWSSVDGINWVQETASSPWSARMGHTSLVFDGYMWVIGGFDYSLASAPYNIIYTDAWKSRDGITWTRATTNIPNLNGDGFAGVVFP